jgi:hypothetical protein
MLMLNELTPLMVGETLSVNVAEVDCPGSSEAFSLSNVMLICPAALAGFHAVVVILKVSGTFPVFFT